MTRATHYDTKQRDLNRRYDLLDFLKQYHGQPPMSEITAHLGLSQPTICKYLTLLDMEGLITFTVTMNAGSRGKRTTIIVTKEGRAHKADDLPKNCPMERKHVQKRKGWRDTWTNPYAGLPFEERMNRIVENDIRSRLAPQVTP